MFLDPGLWFLAVRGVIAKELRSLDEQQLLLFELDHLVVGHEPLRVPAARDLVVAVALACMVDLAANASGTASPCWPAILRLSTGRYDLH